MAEATEGRVSESFKLLPRFCYDYYELLIITFNLLSCTQIYNHELRSKKEITDHKRARTKETKQAINEQVLR